jgi:hypothetical protein
VDELELVVRLELTHLRAEVVRERIYEIKDDLVSKSLELGHLLKEARDNQYHVEWGCSQFGQWVENASGLDMSERSAYYLIRIVERSEELGIGDDQLRRVKLSKLKEIFALKAAEPELIKELVTKAETATLEEIRHDCQLVKIADGAEPYLYWACKIPQSVREDLDKSFEKVRRIYGDKFTEDGSIQDIPDWMCLKYIFIEWLNTPVAEDSEVVDAVFEDVAQNYEEA